MKLINTKFQQEVNSDLFRLNLFKNFQMFDQIKQKIKQSFGVKNKSFNSTVKLSPEELQNLFLACVQGDMNSYSLVMEQARENDPNAQEIAGRIYFTGSCVSVDYSEATRWYRKAAEQGHVDSQCSLAINYKNGFGVEKDLEKAKDWFLKSASGGSTFAMFSLAEMYRNGNGVPIDHKKALHWYELGGEAGDTLSQHSAAVCYGTGIGTDIDHNKAFQWGMRSAQTGFPESQRLVAYCYLKGQGVEENQELAVAWYKKSAEKGDVDSIYSLGLIYTKNLKPESLQIETAKFWLKKGAELNDKRCVEELSRLLKWESE